MSSEPRNGAEDWLLISHLQIFPFPPRQLLLSKNNMVKSSSSYQENSLNMSSCKHSAPVSFLSLPDLLRECSTFPPSLPLRSPLSQVWQPDSALSTPHKRCSCQSDQCETTRYIQGSLRTSPQHLTIVTTFLKSSPLLVVDLIFSPDVPSTSFSSWPALKWELYP